LLGDVIVVLLSTERQAKPVTSLFQHASVRIWLKPMLEKGPFSVEISKKIEKIVRINEGYTSSVCIAVNTKNPVT
jgi:hypothetical protein